MRALSPLQGVLRYRCVACPPGEQSLGGLAHSCTACDGITCLPSATAANISTVFEASSLEQGDIFAVQLAAYGGGLQGGDEARGTALSQTALLDATPPTPGNVTDIAPCNSTGCARTLKMPSFGAPELAKAAL